MKKAYLWIVNWGIFGIHKTSYVTADLFFSSPDKFREVVRLDSNYHDVNSKQILIEVQVPLDFDDWDYCPDNY